MFFAGWRRFFGLGPTRGESRGDYYQEKEDRQSADAATICARSCEAIAPFLI
jgi:hypothetical protein